MLPDVALRLTTGAISVVIKVVFVLGFINIMTEFADAVVIKTVGTIVDRDILKLSIIATTGKRKF